MFVKEKWCAIGIWYIVKERERERGKKTNGNKNTKELEYRKRERKIAHRGEEAEPYRCIG